MNDQVREPAVAGMFYPADSRELQGTIKGYLESADAAGPVPKAIIVPHAGYIYSGPVAATAYARIIKARDRIERVVLLGPAHRVGFRGLAASNADFFSTPLGKIPLDTGIISQLLQYPQVHRLEDAHRQEHSLEVHLPFLQEVLDDFLLIPLVVGECSPDEVCEVLEQVWGDEKTLIVISSDLSHYHEYSIAQTMDSATSRAIEALEPEAIGYDHACGRNPVNGLLLAARKHGLKAHTIDLRNSGDTAGPKDQVVGYGAYSFE